MLPAGRGREVLDLEHVGGRPVNLEEGINWTNRKNSEPNGKLRMRAVAIVDFVEHYADKPVNVGCIYYCSHKINLCFIMSLDAYCIQSCFKTIQVGLCRQC